MKYRYFISGEVRDYNSTQFRVFKDLEFKIEDYDSIKRAEEIVATNYSYSTKIYAFSFIKEINNE